MLTSPLPSLVIRPLQLTDTAGLYQLTQRNHERLKKWFPLTLKAISDETAALAYIQKRLQLADQRTGYFFILEDDDTKQLIGALILKSIDWSVPKCEFAYYIDRAYEGRGITSFGVKWLSEYAFEKLKMNKIFLRIGPSNLGSIRIAEKLNFKKEGLIRQDFRMHTGEVVDVAYFGKTQEEFAQETSKS